MHSGVTITSFQAASRKEKRVVQISAETKDMFGFVAPIGIPNLQLDELSVVYFLQQLDEIRTSDRHSWNLATIAALPEIKTNAHKKRRLTKGGNINQEPTSGFLVASFPFHFLDSVRGTASNLPLSEPPVPLYFLGFLEYPSIFVLPRFAAENVCAEFQRAKRKHCVRNPRRNNVCGRYRFFLFHRNVCCLPFISVVYDLPFRCCFTSEMKEKSYRRVVTSRFSESCSSVAGVP